MHRDREARSHEPLAAWAEREDGAGRWQMRLATEGDLAELMVIERSAHHAPWDEEIFTRELGLDFSHTWWVRAPDGELVALLVFWTVHDEIHVLDVAVMKARQGAGLGAWLMRALEAWGEDNGMTLITLEVRAGNEPAKNLYTKCGFEKVGHRKAYYADNGEDAWVMTRILASGAILL